jgi:predicted enzyme related to lactoylglutathione lyase
MGKVTGLGGVFFKARDKAALLAWYRDHLGIDVQSWGGTVFDWRDAADPAKEGSTAWSIFDAKNKKFDPSPAPFMINYRVDDLDAVLATLKAAGADVDPRVEDTDYGRFAWVMDPEGHRIELWQPKES